jgi:polyribonucleotide nucleotidyltransferase
MVRKLIHNQVCGRKENNMSKNLGFILSVLFGIACFSTGTYYSWMNLENKYIKYTEKWEKINSDVEQFVEVSNPKTIQFYVSELRKILDDMTRLSKIIEKGQEIDEAIDKILEGIVQLENQWDITLSNDIKMKETIEVVNDHIKDVDIRSKSQIQNVIDNEIKDIDTRIDKQFEQISKDLKEIKDIINQIENSKVGKKIFK